MRFSIGLLMCAALVAGCSSLITAQNTVRTTATSDVGSERTYRNILSAMRYCYPTDLTFESNYFPEAKEGEIMLTVIAPPQRVEFFKLKVMQAGDKATVEMDSQTKFDGFPAALPQWVRGDGGSCPYGTRIEPPYPSQNPYSPSPR